MEVEKIPAHFSVVVPFYNIADYVEKCMQSILQQSFKDFELIAVDDGSKDQTGTLLDGYAARDPRVHVIHKSNGGLTSARKAGARMARGEYVVIVDGDDWIAPNYLEKLNKIIETAPVDIIICGYFRVSPETSKIKSPLPIQGRYGLFGREEIEKHYLTRLFSVPQNVWAKAFKRDLYLRFQLAMEDAIRMGEDLCITYPCLAQARQIYLLNEPLYFYRINPKSITNSACKYISWKECLSRMKFLTGALPLEKFRLKSQFAGSVCYSLFNVILSHFNNEPYNITVSEARNVLATQEVRYWIEEAGRNSGGRNRLIAYLLHFRLFAIMKLISILKRIYKS